MARNIRIASVPGGPVQVRDTKDYEGCLQEEMDCWTRRLRQIQDEKADLIVTPECCDRPAGMELQDRLAYYQVRGDRMRDFFCGMAKEYNAFIAYSAARSMPDGTYRNSIQLIDRNGQLVDAYNKYVPTIGEYEKGGILYGKDTHVMQTDIGRICGSICFDLNFDEPLRKTAAEHPDMVLFSSNYHGGLMQAYWAYQTRAYFISCIGTDQSANIINPVGRTVAQNSNYYPYLAATINLDYAVAHLDENWDRFRAMKAKYGPLVEMDTPYGLGCTLLTYHGEGVRMRDIVKEFDIELWDDYYERSFAQRSLPGRIEE